MKNKLYLTKFSIPARLNVHIAYYADTPTKNYRIYYNGADSGARFEYLGNAARALMELLTEQKKHGVHGHILTYGTRGTIPQRGSNAK